jgi:hypothetical protein
MQQQPNSLIALRHYLADFAGCRCLHVSHDDLCAQHRTADLLLLLAQTPVTAGTPTCLTSAIKVGVPNRKCLQGQGYS